MTGADNPAGGTPDDGSLEGPGAARAQREVVAAGGQAHALFGAESGGRAGDQDRRHPPSVAL